MKERPVLKGASQGSVGARWQMNAVVVMKFWPVKPGNGVEGKTGNDPEPSAGVPAEA